MNVGKVKEVQLLCIEVERLCDKVVKAQQTEDQDKKKYNWPNDPSSGSKIRWMGNMDTAALRRRSMDLTRKLAELRRS